MKKIYNTILALTVLLMSGSAFATIHQVQVNSSSFSPTPITVTVGDTVQWNHTGGSHTTTSVTIPATAAPWDSPITSGVPMFQYVVTVAGNYSYKCTPHGFTGAFTALSNIGVSEIKPVLGISIYTTGSAFTISYELTHSSDIQISLFDLTGKGVRELSKSIKSTGTYEETFDLSDLKKGIYLVQLISENQRLTKRIILE